MEQQGIGSFNFLYGASTRLKQPSTLLNVCLFKIKSNSKYSKSSRMAPKHAKWQIFIHYKTFTLGGNKNLLRTTTLVGLYLVVVLWRCFMRWAPVQEDHFWVVPRVVVLYRFDCISELDYASGYFNTT